LLAAKILILLFLSFIINKIPVVSLKSLVCLSSINVAETKLLWQACSNFLAISVLKTGSLSSLVIRFSYFLPTLSIMFFVILSVIFLATSFILK
jgi:hypothetical protein